MDSAVLESERLETLRRLHILDTPPEAAFDRITQLAARIFDMPICLVSLIDEHRQWFKSCWGLADYGVFARETPLDVSFCVHALMLHEVMVVTDTLQDSRFAEYPVVTGSPGVRFYAGAPIRVRVPLEGDRRMSERRTECGLMADPERREGERRAPDSRDADHSLALGTLCLIDTRPRAFGREQRGMLCDLATLVENEIRLRFTATMLQREIEARTAAEAKLASTGDAAQLKQDATAQLGQLREPLVKVMDATDKLAGANLEPAFAEDVARLREAGQQLLALVDNAA